MEEGKEYEGTLQIHQVKPNHWRLRMDCRARPEVWFEVPIAFNETERDFKVDGDIKGRLSGANSELTVTLNKGAVLVLDQVNFTHSASAQLPVGMLSRVF